MSAGKQEHINKLIKELAAVEDKYKQIIGENAMIGEDYRSWAVHNHNIIADRDVKITKHEKKLTKMEDEVKDQAVIIVGQKTEMEILMMAEEDVCGRY